MTPDLLKPWLDPLAPAIVNALASSLVTASGAWVVGVWKRRHLRDVAAAMTRK